MGGVDNDSTSVSLLQFDAEMLVLRKSKFGGEVEYVFGHVTLGNVSGTLCGLSGEMSGSVTGMWF